MASQDNELRKKRIESIVRWPGGKSRLLNKILPRIPDDTERYCEPFLGGGAVLFSLMPNHAITNDLNSELMLMYRTVRDDPEKVISELKKHKYTKEYFCKIREWDRNKYVLQNKTDAERAARFLYLNAACFNGVHRVNSKGQFNSSFNKKITPINEARLCAVSEYLKDHKIALYSADFEEVLCMLNERDFAYIDPPYYPISSASFTRYTQFPFKEKEQIRLKEVCDRLNSRGVRFLLSNSDTPFINELYKDYNISKITARRSVGNWQGYAQSASEILASNY